MNIEQAKAIPLTKILEHLNLRPKREFKDNAWYLSPLRDEKTASFHVNTNKNVWYDFGEGIGGDGINLAQEILKLQQLNSSKSEALKWLKNTLAGNVLFLPRSPNDKIHEPDGYRYLLEYATPIYNAHLIDYLSSRGIPLSVASKSLLQVFVRNKVTDRRLFALGLRNVRGGYELLNPYIKGSIGAKSISFIRGSKPKPPGIHFFEGMMDYLSVVTQMNGRKLQDDAIILNSVNNLPQVLPYLYQYGYSVGYTWMDNDRAGEKAQTSLKHIFRQENTFMAHSPMNEVYKPFKDVNAWHMNKLEL